MKIRHVRAQKALSDIVYPQGLLKISRSKLCTDISALTARRVFLQKASSRVAECFDKTKHMLNIGQRAAQLPLLQD